MQGAINLTIACVCTLLCISLAVPSFCEPLPLGQENAPIRTGRNKPFGSPDELRSYLDELGQYFAVVGRPRFGKRTMVPFPAGPSIRQPTNLRLGTGVGLLPADGSGDLYRLFYTPENDVS